MEEEETFSSSNLGYEAVETDNMRAIEQYASFLTTSDEKYRKIRDKLFHVEMKRFSQDFIEQVLVDNDNLRKSREKLLEICRPLAQQNLEYAKQLQVLKKQNENSNQMCVAWQHAKEQMYLLFKRTEKELVEKTKKLEIAEKSLSQLRRLEAKRKKKSHSSVVKEDTANDTQPSSASPFDDAAEQESISVKDDTTSGSVITNGKTGAALGEDGNSSDEELNLCEVISAWNVKQTENTPSLPQSTCNSLSKPTEVSNSIAVKTKGIKNSVKKTKKARRKTVSSDLGPRLSYNDEKSNSSSNSFKGAPSQEDNECNRDFDLEGDCNTFSPELSLERVESAPGGVLSPKLSNSADDNFEKIKFTTPFIPAVSTAEIKPENKLPTRLPHSSPSEPKKHTVAKKSGSDLVEKSLRSRKVTVPVKNITPSKETSNKRMTRSSPGKIISRYTQIKTVGNYDTIFDDLDISDSDSSIVQSSVPSSQTFKSLTSKTQVESDSDANENFSDTTKAASPEKVLSICDKSDTSVLGLGENAFSCNEDRSPSHEKVSTPSNQNVSAMEKNASSPTKLRCDPEALSVNLSENSVETHVDSLTSPVRSDSTDISLRSTKVLHELPLTRLKSLSESSSDSDHLPQIFSSVTFRRSPRNKKAVGKTIKNPSKKTASARQLNKPITASQVLVNQSEIPETTIQNSKSIFDCDEESDIPNEETTPASAKKQSYSETIPEKTVKEKCNKRKSGPKKRNINELKTEEVAVEFSTSNLIEFKAESKKEIVEAVRSQSKLNLESLDDEKPDEILESTKSTELISNETDDNTKSYFGDSFLGDINFEHQGMIAPTPPDDTELSDVGSPDVVTPPLSPVSSIGSSPLFKKPRNYSAIQDFEYVPTSPNYHPTYEVSEIIKTTGCEKFFVSIDDADCEHLDERPDSSGDGELVQEHEVDEFMDGFDSDEEEPILNLVHKEFAKCRPLSPLPISPEAKRSQKKSEPVPAIEESTLNIVDCNVPDELPSKLSLLETHLNKEIEVENVNPEQVCEQTVSSKPVPESIELTENTNSNESTGFTLDEHTPELPSAESTTVTTTLKNRLAATLSITEINGVADLPREVRKRRSSSLKSVTPEKRSKHTESSESNASKIDLSEQGHLPASVKNIVALEYRRRSLRSTSVIDMPSSSCSASVASKKPSSTSKPLVNLPNNLDNEEVRRKGRKPKINEVSSNFMQPVGFKFSQSQNEKQQQSVEQSASPPESSPKALVTAMQVNEPSFKQEDVKEFGMVCKPAEVQNERPDLNCLTSEFSSDNSLESGKRSNKNMSISSCSPAKSIKTQSNSDLEIIMESYKCERNCLWTGFKYYKEEHCLKLAEDAETEIEAKRSNKLKDHERFMHQDLAMRMLAIVTEPRESWPKDAEICTKNLWNVDEMSIVNSVIKYLQEDTSEVDEAMQPQLTTTQKLILVICHRLTSSHHPTLLSSLLRAIERILFLGDDHTSTDDTKKKNKAKIKQELEFQVQSTRNLSKFFAIACKSLGQLQRCRAFVFDALYMSVNRAHLMVNSVLSVWPYAFLPAHKSKDCPLTMVLVFEIFSHISTKKQDFYEIEELKNSLTQYYGYSNPLLSQKTREDLMTTLSTVLDRRGSIEAFVLLAKRGQWKWTASKLVFGFLVPLLDDFKDGKIEEEKAKAIVKILGLVTRAFPTGEAWLETKKVLEYLEQLLLNDNLGTLSFKESVAVSVVKLYRSDPDVCLSILSKWNPPSGELSVKFLENIKSLFYIKKLPNWYREISTICSS